MLNRIILMGRLAADPELRTTPNGVSVVSFRIGVTRDYNRDQTDWINIVAWRQTAEFVSKYFFKGSMIALEGSLQSRQYQDRDGNNRTAYEVQADRVWFAESKNASSHQGESRFAPPAEHPAAAGPDPAKSANTSFSVGDLEDYEDLGGSDADLPF